MKDKIIRDTAFEFEPEAGISLRGKRWGQPGAHPMIFMYGLGCGISHWRNQMEYFRSGRFSGVVQGGWIDYRGHGSSDPLSAGEALTLSRTAADVIAWLDSMSVRGVTLLGQSLGGTIALQVASLRPDLVGRIVMVGAPPRAASKAFRFGGPSAMLWKAMAELNATVRPPLRILNKIFEVGHVPLREVIRVMGFNPLRAATQDVDEYVRELSRTDFNVFFDLARDLESFDIARLEPRVECPVLIIAGRRDLVIPPREIDYMASYLPHAEVEWIANGSHCPHHDDPAAVNYRIELFMRDHGCLVKGVKRRVKGTQD